MAVQNGRLDTALLVAVAPGLHLTARAAASWLRLAADVHARYGWTPTLTDAYRPYSEQVRIFNERYDLSAAGYGPFGDVRWWQGRRYVRMRGAAAAVPGTSNHGLGETVDVTGLGKFTSVRYAQFAEVAAEHGWSNAEGRKVKEPWHWVRVADLNPTPPPTPAVPIPVTIPTPPAPQSEEDDMDRFIELLYLGYLDRSAAPLDVIDLSKRAESSGWTRAQTEAAFVTNRAEAGTVRAAFRHFLGRSPDTAAIAEWSDTETIAQVWAGVGGSPEALARR